MIASVFTGHLILLFFIPHRLIFGALSLPSLQITAAHPPGSSFTQEYDMFSHQHIVQPKITFALFAHFHVVPKLDLGAKCDFEGYPADIFHI